MSSSATAATVRTDAGSTPVVGRIPVLGVEPVVDAGRWPSQAVPGELIPVRATVFREGHDAVAATAVLVRPDGTDGPSTRMTLVNAGKDAYAATALPRRARATGACGSRAGRTPTAPGTTTPTIKVEAGVDVALMLEEGARLLERAAAAAGRTRGDAAVLREAAGALRDTARGDHERLDAGRTDAVHAVLDRLPVRDLVTASATYPLRVERRAGRVQRLVRVLPPLRGRALGRGGRAAGCRARSAPPPSACPRSPTWASTSPT